MAKQDSPANMEVIRMASKYEVVASGMVVYMDCDATPKEFSMALNSPTCGCILVDVLIVREYNRAGFNHARSYRGRGVVWWMLPTTNALRGIAHGFTNLFQMCTEIRSDGFFKLKNPIPEIIWQGRAHNIPFRFAHIRSKLHSMAHDLMRERLEEIHRSKFPESPAVGLE